MQAECLDYLEEQIFVHLISPDEVAAVIVEPIQGEGGYVVPPAVFHQRLRELTTQHGILLICDEVQSGMGRTGKMFGIEHFGVQPDMVTIAKGVASGLPLGVTVARAEVMSWPPGAHASTFGGNPVSCAASLATIDLLRTSLMQNSAEVGAYMMDLLKGLQEKHAIIGDVRGRGLMIGVELVRDRTTKERAVEERNRVVDECFKRGLLVLGAGRNEHPPVAAAGADQGAGEDGGGDPGRGPGFAEGRGLEGWRLGSVGGRASLRSVGREASPLPGSVRVSNCIANLPEPWAGALHSRP